MFDGKSAKWKRYRRHAEKYKTLNDATENSTNRINLTFFVKLCICVWVNGQRLFHSIFFSSLLNRKINEIAFYLLVFFSLFWILNRFKWRNAGIGQTINQIILMLSFIVQNRYKWFEHHFMNELLCYSSKRCTFIYNQSIARYEYDIRVFWMNWSFFDE